MTSRRKFIEELRREDAQAKQTFAAVAEYRRGALQGQMDTACVVLARLKASADSFPAPTARMSPFESAGPAIALGMARVKMEQVVKTLEELARDFELSAQLRAK